MRLQMTITELDEERWAYLHSSVQAEYDIPADASRVCLTFTHGEGVERHAEMPLGSLIGLLVGLAMVGVTRELRNAVAKLRPVDLPAFLNQVRREADPAHGQSPAGRRPILPTPDMVRGLSAEQARELTELLNRPCDHDSPVTGYEPSQFDSAPPVRTHEDGCQSYGPYADPQRPAERQGAPCPDNMADCPIKHADAKRYDT